MEAIYETVLSDLARTELTAKQAEKQFAAEPTPENRHRLGLAEIMKGCAAANYKMLTDGLESLAVKDEAEKTKRQDEAGLMGYFLNLLGMVADRAQDLLNADTENLHARTQALQSALDVVNAEADKVLR